MGRDLENIKSYNTKSGGGQRGYLQKTLSVFILKNMQAKKANRNFYPIFIS